MRIAKYGSLREVKIGLRLPQAGESHATIIISLAKGAENASFDSCGF